MQDVFQVLVDDKQVNAAAMIAFSNAKEPRIVAENNLAKISESELFGLDPDHVSLLKETLSHGKPRMISARSIPDSGIKPHSIAMAPILLPGHPAHIIEIFTLDVHNSEVAAYLRELIETIAGYFTRYLNSKNVQLEPTTDDNFWQRFDSFILRLQTLARPETDNLSGCQ